MVEVVVVVGGCCTVVMHRYEDFPDGAVLVCTCTRGMPKVGRNS